MYYIELFSIKKVKHWYKYMKIRTILFTALLITLVFQGNINNKQACLANVSPEDLSVIENTLFQQTYGTQSTENRLAKIEKLIYGQSFEDQAVQARLNKLETFLPADHTPRAKVDVLPEKNESANEISSTPVGVLPAIPGVERKLPPDVEKWLAENTGTTAEGTLPPRNNTVFTEEPERQNERPFQYSGGDALAGESPSMNRENQDYQNILPENKNQQEPPVDTIAQANYPLIDQIEQQMFGQAYTAENIYKRLERLETKIDGRVSKASLYDRVNNIQDKAHYNNLRDKFAEQYRPVQPQAQYPDNYAGSSQSNYTTRGLNSSQTYSHSNTISHATVGIQGPAPGSAASSAMSSTGFGAMGEKLSALEMQLFGKTYDDDLSLNRIDRIERKVIGKTSFGLVNERLEKVYAAMSGRKADSSSNFRSFYFTDDGYERPQQQQQVNTSIPGQFMFGGSMGNSNVSQYTGNGYSTSSSSNMNYGNNLLNQVEMRVFGRAYPEMNMNTRVSRLENTLFGRMSGGDLNVRIQRLVQACNSTAYAGGSYAQPYNTYTQPYNNYAGTSYSGYTNPYNYYNSGLPVTPKAMVGAAAGAAIDNTVGKKSGILSQIGKAAGQAILGVPTNPYGAYNPYGGYNNYRY
jgi:hypothetical protein